MLALDTFHREGATHTCAPGICSFRQVGHAPRLEFVCLNSGTMHKCGSACNEAVPAEKASIVICGLTGTPLNTFTVADDTEGMGTLSKRQPVGMGGRSSSEGAGSCAPKSGTGIRMRYEPGSDVYSDEYGLQIGPPRGSCVRGRSDEGRFRGDGTPVSGTCTTRPVVHLVKLPGSKKRDRGFAALDREGEGDTSSLPSCTAIDNGVKHDSKPKQKRGKQTKEDQLIKARVEIKKYLDEKTSTESRESYLAQIEKSVRERALSEVKKCMSAANKLKLQGVGTCKNGSSGWNEGGEDGAAHERPRGDSGTGESLVVATPPYDMTSKFEEVYRRMLAERGVGSPVPSKERMNDLLEFILRNFERYLEMFDKVSGAGELRKMQPLEFAIGLLMVLKEGTVGVSPNPELAFMIQPGHSSGSDDIGSRRMIPIKLRCAKFLQRCLSAETVF